jgi:type VI secretion system Hcp family effector
LSWRVTAVKNRNHQLKEKDRMNRIHQDRIFRFKFVVFAALLLLPGAATGRAQGRNGQDIKLRVNISGIQGDAVGGAIEAFGSDQILTNLPSIDGGGAGGAGKAQFGPLVVIKAVDSATPKLFLAAATGQHQAQAQVSWIRKSLLTGADEVFFTVLLQDVLVRSVRSSLPNQNDPSLKLLGQVEEVSLDFATVPVDVLPPGWNPGQRRVQQ